MRDRKIKIVSCYRFLTYVGQIHQDKRIKEGKRREERTFAVSKAFRVNLKNLLTGVPFLFSKIFCFQDFRYPIPAS